MLEKEQKKTARKIEQPARQGLKLRGWAASIPRAIPSVTARKRAKKKISNARVIEEHPRVECSAELLSLEDTRHPLCPLLPSCLPFVPRFLVPPACSLSSFFSVVRDNDTHTLSLGNNINGFVYPETIGVRQKEHDGEMHPPCPLCKGSLVRSDLEAASPRILYAESVDSREFNSRGLASHSFIRPASSALSSLVLLFFLLFFFFVVVVVSFDKADVN